MDPAKMHEIADQLIEAGQKMKDEAFWHECEKHGRGVLRQLEDPAALEEWDFQVVAYENADGKDVHFGVYGLPRTGNAKFLGGNIRSIWNQREKGKPEAADMWQKVDDCLKKILGSHACVGLTAKPCMIATGYIRPEELQKLVAQYPNWNWVDANNAEETIDNYIKAKEKEIAEVNSVIDKMMLAKELTQTIQEQEQTDEH